MATRLSKRLFHLVNKHGAGRAIPIKKYLLHMAFSIVMNHDVTKNLKSLIGSRNRPSNISYSKVPESQIAPVEVHSF
jgi:hypothetical protein